ncbi:MAG: putative sulfate/molybdate transporter [Elusimicrobia bacterium]|nr:putative sulfate/molybdate transporter [Elusimicrobiota bacterium]
MSLRRISFGPGEWTGAMGDLGISVPVLLALSASGSLDLSRALLLFGAVYIGAGLYFRLPIPVQPLKAATALVIARGLGGAALRACALWMAAILAVFSLTGFSDRINRLFTRTIVRGIQLGVGLLLLKAAYKLLLSSPHAAAAVPASAAFPSLPELTSAFWVLVLPQLPLTLGNSVAATCDVSAGYFGEEAARVRPRPVTMSIALSNLAAGLLGGMPVCHGSGGVTAHHKFGARTAGSTIILGAAFISLALMLGSAGAAAALAAIPRWLLAGLLAWTGLLHARLVLDKKAALPVALAMGALGLATSNLSYALALGLAAEGALRWTPLSRLQGARS